MTDYTPESYRIVHLTTADFNKRILPRPIHIVQYDDSIPILAVSLYLDGNQYTIPNSAEMNIRFGKKDGTFVYNPALGCSSDRHTVYFEVTQQMTMNRGRFNPIVEIVVGGNIAGSSCIDIEIDRNPIQETDIESNTEFITMQEYVYKAENASNNAKISEKKASESESSASKYADSIQESYTTMVEELNKKADKTDVEINLKLKQDVLVLDNVPKIGSQNYVNSDRIAAALTYKADTKVLSEKANKTDVEKSLLLKENASNKITTFDKTFADVDKFPTAVAIMKFLSDYFYNADEADELLGSKYDASNFEVGTGDFTIVSDATKPYIKSATFKYQKTGKTATLFGNIQFNEGVLPVNGYVQLSGIPFRSIATSRVVSSTSKYSNVVVTVVTGTWITLNFGTVSPRSQDELLQFSVSYLIS